MVLLLYTDITVADLVSDDEIISFPPLDTTESQQSEPILNITASLLSILFVFSF